MAITESIPSLSMNGWRRVWCAVLSGALAIGSLPAVSAAPTPLDLAQLDLESFTIPERLGSIVETWQPTGQAPTGFVIHLQDVHADPEAQTNTSELVGYLHDRFGIELVALEGGAGLCDTTLYSDLPDPPTTEPIARLFLRDGWLTGAEYYGITHPGVVTIWGIEDAATYREQFGAHRRATIRQAEHAATLAAVRQALERLAQQRYPAALKRLLALRHAYERDAGDSGNTFHAYLADLWRLAAQRKLALSAYPLVRTYVRLARVSINAELRTLAAGSTYQQLAAQLHSAQFLHEIDALQQAVETAWFTTDEQRTLARLLHQLTLLDDLTQLRLSRSGLASYREQRNTLTLEAWWHALDALTRGRPPVPKADLERLFSSLPSRERFYELAIRRDELLVHHTLRRMQQASQPAAVLIAGGFHTDGLTAQLRHQQVAYVVIAPTLHGTPDRAVYEARLRNRLPPAERFLAQLQTHAFNAVVTTNQLSDSVPTQIQINGQTATVSLKEALLGYALWMKDQLWRLKAATGQELRDVPARLARLRQWLGERQHALRYIAAAVTAGRLALILADGQTQITLLDFAPFVLIAGIGNVSPDDEKPSESTPPAPGLITSGETGRVLPGMEDSAVGLSVVGTDAEAREEFLHRVNEQAPGLWQAIQAMGEVIDVDWMVRDELSGEKNVWIVRLKGAGSSLRVVVRRRGAGSYDREGASAAQSAMHALTPQAVPAVLATQTARDGAEWVMCEYADGYPLKNYLDYRVLGDGGVIDQQAQGRLMEVLRQVGELVAVWGASGHRHGDLHLLHILMPLAGAAAPQIYDFGSAADLLPSDPDTKDLDTLIEDFEGYLSAVSVDVPVEEAVVDQYQDAVQHSYLGVLPIAQRLLIGEIGLEDANRQLDAIGAVGRFIDRDGRPVYWFGDPPMRDSSIPLRADSAAPAAAAAEAEEPLPDEVSARLVQVTDQVWVGQHTVRDRSGGQFDAVLNVAEEIADPAPPYLYAYKHVALTEFPLFPIDDLREAVTWIHEQVAQGKTVLVHCYAGEYCAPMIAFAYVYWTRPDLNFVQAVREVQSHAGGRWEDFMNKWELLSALVDPATRPPLSMVRLPAIPKVRRKEMEQSVARGEPVEWHWWRALGTLPTLAPTAGEAIDDALRYDPERFTRLLNSKGKLLRGVEVIIEGKVVTPPSTARQDWRDIPLPLGSTIELRKHSTIDSAAPPAAEIVAARPQSPAPAAARETGGVPPGASSAESAAPPAAAPEAEESLLDEASARFETHQPTLGEMRRRDKKRTGKPRQPKEAVPNSGAVDVAASGDAGSPQFSTFSVDLLRDYGGLDDTLQPSADYVDAHHEPNRTRLVVKVHGAASMRVSAGQEVMLETGGGADRTPYEDAKSCSIVAWRAESDDGPEIGVSHVHQGEFARDGPYPYLQFWTQDVLHLVARELTSRGLRDIQFVVEHDPVYSTPAVLKTKLRETARIIAVRPRRYDSSHPLPDDPAGMYQARAIVTAQGVELGWRLPNEASYRPEVIPWETSPATAPPAAEADQAVTSSDMPVAPPAEAVTKPEELVVPRGSYSVWVPWVTHGPQVLWKVFPGVYPPDDNSGGEHFAEVLGRLQVTRPNLIRGGRWCDVGVGSGVLSGYLLDHEAAEVVGLDIVRASIPNTRWNLRAHFPAVADRFHGYVGDLWDALPPGEQARPFDGALFNAPPWEGAPDPTQPDSFHAGAGKGWPTIARFLKDLPHRLAPGRTAYVRVKRFDELATLIPPKLAMTPERLARMVADLQLPLTVQLALPAGHAERGSFVILALTHAPSAPTESPQ